MLNDNPPFVNRLANIGRFFSCILPRAMLESAPVGDVHTASTGGDSTFRAYTTSGPSTNATIHAFSGSGYSLGSSMSAADSSSAIGSLWRHGNSSHHLNSSSNTSTASNNNNNFNNNNSKVDDLTDRREKARLAALKRLEGQKH